MARQKVSINSEKDIFIEFESAKVKDIWQQAERIAPLPINILIEGETGTGKEILARQIHSFSKRTGNFIVFDCASISRELFDSTVFGHREGSFTGAMCDVEGLAQAANHGTLFIDHVNQLDFNEQVKLLRLLENQEVIRLGDANLQKLNLRIIAAVNASLSNLVKTGKFREDLFYRLNVFHLSLPPLREITDDLPELIRFLLEKENQIQKKEVRLSQEIFQILLFHHWTGNFRELRSIITRLVTFGDDLISGEIVRKYCPELFNFKKSSENNSGHLNSYLYDIEAKELEKALKFSAGGIRETARLLGIPHNTLIYRLKKHPELKKYYSV